jgi:hypothetical protein
MSDLETEVFGTSLVDIETIRAPKFAIEKTGKAFCVLKIHGVPIDVSVPWIEIKSDIGTRTFPSILSKNVILKQPPAGETLP